MLLMPHLSAGGSHLLCTLRLQAVGKTHATFRAVHYDSFYQNGQKCPILAKENADFLIRLLSNTFFHSKRVLRTVKNIYQKNAQSHMEIEEYFVALPKAFAKDV